MKAFRPLALGYALVALLIAPAWIAADERAVPTVPEAVEQPGEAAEPAPDSTGGSGDDDEPQPGGAEDEQRPAAPADDAEPTGTGNATPAESEQDEPAREERRSDEAAAKAAQSGSVTITDFEFTPATITVDVGDTVTWTNDGPSVHTATAEDGSFDTGNLRAGQSGSATFDQPDTVAYICTPHPFMKGRVVVRGQSAGSPGGGGGTGSAGSDDAATPGADSTAAADGGSDLPATGLEVLLIALLGVATLATGLLLRRRAKPN